MFDVGAGELLVIGLVALIVIGPKDLPKAIRAAGRTMGKIRSTASDFRHNLDVLAREAELNELRQQTEQAVKTDIPNIDLSSELDAPIPHEAFAAPKKPGSEGESKA